MITATSVSYLSLLVMLDFSLQTGLLFVFCFAYFLIHLIIFCQKTDLFFGTCFNGTSGSSASTVTISVTLASSCAFKNVFYYYRYRKAHIFLTSLILSPLTLAFPKCSYLEECITCLLVM